MRSRRSSRRCWGLESLAPSPSLGSTIGCGPNVRGREWRMASGEWGVGRRAWGQSTTVIPGRSPGLDPGRRGRGSSGEWRMGSSEWGAGPGEAHHCHPRPSGARGRGSSLAVRSEHGSPSLACGSPGMTVAGGPPSFATRHSPFATQSRTPPLRSGPARQSRVWLARVIALRGRPRPSAGPARASWW